MKKSVRFNKNHPDPLFRQLMNYITECIMSGEFPADKPLPSLNAMTIRTGLSKETVIKAYSHLCKGGAISSLPGRGYFVREGFLSGKPSLFVLMDKLSVHQQSIMDGIVSTLAGKADITIRMHYQDIYQFETELGKALDRYDWYLVFPHFSPEKSVQDKALTLLNTIPAEKLIVLDRLPCGISELSGASYQSIEDDIPLMLGSVLDDIRKYDRLRYISLSVSLYGNLVAEVISEFCERNSVPVEVLREVPEDIGERICSSCRAAVWIKNCPS